MDRTVNSGAGSAIAATPTPGKDAQEHLVLQLVSILGLRKASLVPVQLSFLPFHHHRLLSRRTGMHLGKNKNVVSTWSSVCWPVEVGL